MTHRLQKARLFAGGVVLAPLLACAVQSELPSEPPEGMEVAWFHDDCAPWDGPAMSLYLSREPSDDVFTAPFPHLRLSIYSSRLRLPVRERVVFEVPGNDGHAVYCEAPDSCMDATSVALELTGIDDDLLTGRLQVEFGDRPPLRGGFRAVRLEFLALCG